MSLTSKVALVTGASRGIGRAIALRLARDGAHVLVNYRSDEASARGVVQEVEAAGGQASLLQFDVANLEQTRAAVADLGGLDILVNNAGTAVFGPMAEVTAQQYDAMFDLNVKGLFWLTHAVVPQLREGGRIVNISSGITRSNGGYGSVYAATKSAVEAFSRAWAVELGPRHITVNTVSPGMTETDLLREAVPQDRQTAGVANTPLGRLGQPADIAEVVAYLCSPGANWVTANNLLANGGA